MVSSVWRRSGGAFSAVLALIAVCMAMCVAAPTQALAKSYEISRVAIDATLDADGTLHVTEDRTLILTATSTAFTGGCLRETTRGGSWSLRWNRWEW